MERWPSTERQMPLQCSSEGVLQLCFLISSFCVDCFWGPNNYKWWTKPTYLAFLCEHPEFTQSSLLLFSLRGTSSNVGCLTPTWTLAFIQMGIITPPIKTWHSSLLWTLLSLFLQLLLHTSHFHIYTLLPNFAQTCMSDLIPDWFSAPLTSCCSAAFPLSSVQEASRNITLLCNTRNEGIMCIMASDRLQHTVVNIRQSKWNIYLKIPQGAPKRCSRTRKYLKHKTLHIILDQRSVSENLLLKYPGKSNTTDV